ncbi:FtsX-like permease family protein [Streptomyces sp. NPDC001700]
MLSLAWATLRTRWVGFAGAFLALALGTAMVAVTALTLAATLATPFPGPQRFAADTAPTVVVPKDPVPYLRWAAKPPAALSAAQADRISALGEAVADRTFPVGVPGGVPGGTGESVGHGWSSAAFGPYRLTSGRAPAADREVVVGGGSALVGHRITIGTPRGRTAYTVVGATSGVWFEHPVFFTDRESARLSPPVNALVSRAGTESVRQSVQRAAGAGVLVLTGDDRKKADPDPSGGSDQLRDARAMTSTTLGVAVGVAAFIVAATFAFMADQRRRELALLRLIGSTPAQVRRTVLTEAVLIGLVAAVAGCALGVAAVGPLHDWMLDHDIAPAWFDIGVTPWPLILAFLVGVLAAIGGAATVAVQAGRVAPIEALRDAAADTRRMSPVRWVLGTGMLLGALGTAAYFAVESPDVAVNPRKFAAVPLLFVGAFALFAPLVLPPVTRVLTSPLERFGAGAVIVRQNLLTARRRTAATVAPVVVAVGLVTTMGLVTDSGDRTSADQARARVRADVVVLPEDGGRLDRDTVSRVGALPGVRAAVPVAPARVYLPGPDGQVADGVMGTAVDPAAMGGTLAPRVVEGSLRDLGHDFLVVDAPTADDHGYAPGSEVTVWLPDNSRATLTVAAVVEAGLSDHGGYLSTRHAAGALPERMLLRLDAGTDPAAGAAQVATALRGQAVTVMTAADWFAETRADQRQRNRTGTRMVLGIAVGYALIAVANTLAMAAAGRRRELAAFSLAGATRGQALRMVTAESLIAGLLGTLLALAAGAAALLAQYASLAALVGRISPSAPWQSIGLTAVVSVATAVATAAVSVTRTIRRRAVELAALRD